MRHIAILAGNIGQAPEARYPCKGARRSCTSPSPPLARAWPKAARSATSTVTQVMATEWHRITCFNGLGKSVAENCEKGMNVLVQGRIHYTKWTDAAGVDRYGCEIIAEKVDLLSRPKATEGDGPELVDRDRDDEVGF
ncbi:single-stranded DNA-binding protein [Stagnihabitans tardus]|uniref:Single-stranded DNA-binding protein n=1 Tax=Stagnihabitans tardus TaxID=2699202 RepID=A0AAE5BXE6_9RHOB|nr:single-stranded DNA-binding protein [Stagnihabitans tardus]